jgi:hypothetical protein
MTTRTQITLDPDLRRRARAKATGLGISFAEYVRRVLAKDLGAPQRKPNISVIFDIVDEGPATNIARDKDKMVGDAAWQEHLRKTRGKRARRKARPSRR